MKCPIYEMSYHEMSYDFLSMKCPSIKCHNAKYVSFKILKKVSKLNLKKEEIYQLRLVH